MEDIFKPLNIKGYEINFKTPSFKDSILRHRGRNSSCNYYIKINNFKYKTSPQDNYKNFRPSRLWPCKAVLCYIIKHM